MCRRNDEDEDMFSEIEKKEKLRQALSDQIQEMKYDLENIVYKILSFRQKFFNRCELKAISFECEDPYVELSVLIDSMRTSIIAPAYHFNKYIDGLVLDVLWDDLKYSIPREEWVSSSLRALTYRVEVQAIFYSIKMALDRLVAIFIFYYRGISSNSTFGRYKGNEARGFMSKVAELKDFDKLMEYIDEEYRVWIKYAVQPRDIITHYQDLGITYRFDSNIFAEIPIHVVSSFEEDSEPSFGYTYEHLKNFVDSWYTFFEKVLNILLEKELVFLKDKKEKVSQEELYKTTKDNLYNDTNRELEEWVKISKEIKMEKRKDKMTKLMKEYNLSRIQCHVILSESDKNS